MLHLSCSASGQSGVCGLCPQSQRGVLTIFSLKIYLILPNTRQSFFCCCCLVVFLKFSSATRLSRGRVPRLTSDNFTCCHTETKRGDHFFCLSQSHYTDTDPNSRERARGPTTSSPGVARSTQRIPPPSPPPAI